MDCLNLIMSSMADSPFLYPNWLLGVRRRSVLSIRSVCSFGHILYISWVKKIGYSSRILTCYFLRICVISPIFHVPSIVCPALMLFAIPCAKRDICAHIILYTPLVFHRRPLIYYFLDFFYCPDYFNVGIWPRAPFLHAWAPHALVCVILAVSVFPLLLLV